VPPATTATDWRKSARSMANANCVEVTTVIDATTPAR